MEFKDYYSKLGVEKSATQEEIKRAYRKLARKYHPDVSKESDAEAQFKEVAEAYEALKDPEKRAAYDAAGSQNSGGTEFRPPPGWNSGFEFDGDAASNLDHSSFFEALFGRAGRGAHAPAHATGEDQHATVQIDLLDSYRGARRTFSLQAPVRDAEGKVIVQSRQLEVNIPKGIRDGQHLRLKGQGSPGHGNGPAGDLYLEVHFNPHERYRVEGRDVYVDLPVAPWEAALGASITVPAPDGDVQLTIPPSSPSGRILRLRGKGLPGTPAGDLLAVLVIALPRADNEAAQAAWRTLASSFVDFNPRISVEA